MLILQIPLGRLLQQPWSNAPEAPEHYSRASVSLLRGFWRKVTEGAVKVFRTSVVFLQAATGYALAAVDAVDERQFVDENRKK
ncbi:MAG: hypothetical protein J6I34_06045 [Prevotella sp.]|nr:hypothetical protein [Prevotella sp.]